MPLPTLSAEQRTEALQKAALARKERADVKDRLKAGQLTLAEVINDGGDITAGMKVSAVLEAMPGVGKVKAAQIMERIGIDERRRVRGLGSNQRDALEREFAGA